MCEPHHSFIQTPHDHDDPDSGHGARPSGPVMGFLRNAGKRVLKWLHLTKFGTGHHGILPPKIQLDNIGPYVFYETKWWTREVKVDWASGVTDQFGRRLHPTVDRDSEQMHAAIEFDRSVVTGSMSSLRKFLEQSVKNTKWEIRSYYERFMEMLTEKGRNEFYRKVRSFCGRKPGNTILLSHRDQLAKSMCGLTRKRKLLIPTWADDGKLWTPAGQIAVATSCRNEQGTVH